MSPQGAANPRNPRNPRNPSGPENGEHRSEDVDADPLIKQLPSAFMLVRSMASVFSHLIRSFKTLSQLSVFSNISGQFGSLESVFTSQAKVGLCEHVLPAKFDS